MVKEVSIRDVSGREISVEDVSGQGNVQWGNIHQGSVRRASVRSPSMICSFLTLTLQNVCLRKYQSGKCPSEMLLVGDVSGHGNVCWGSVWTLSFITLYVFLASPLNFCSFSDWNSISF